MLLCFSVWDATVPKLPSTTPETKSFTDGEIEVSFSSVRLCTKHVCEFKCGFSHQSFKNRANISLRITENLETDRFFPQCFANVL